MTAPVSFGQRIRDLADARGEQVALVFIDVDGSEAGITYRDLDRRSEALAHRLRAAGVGANDLVGIVLRNSPEHVIAALAVWKVGATVLTIRWDVPDWERGRLLTAARPAALIGETEGVDSSTDAPLPMVPVNLSADDYKQTGTTSLRLVDCTPKRLVAVPSGGSTGASKAIVMPIPGALVPGRAFGATSATFGIEPIERHIVFAPLYHGNPFVMVHTSLFDGHTVILLEKFRTGLLIDAIARHHPNFMTLAPTMMKRMLDDPAIASVDWSCFHMILHGTGPCSAALKRQWIDLVGETRLWETFASTELVGSLIVRGDEWLEHPGTVGRPSPTTELRVLDESGAAVPTGTIGEIYMRTKGAGAPKFAYLGGDQAKVDTEGFVSVGDLGWVDEDGFVYSADRRADLIIRGGANVVPAEVEAALSEHPEVADCAVIGLADDDLGQRVHAVVVARSPEHPPTIEALERHCRDRLAAYKVPRGFEFVEALPRSDMFKIRRSALVADRESTPGN